MSVIAALRVAPRLAALSLLMSGVLSCATNPGPPPLDLSASRTEVPALPVWKDLQSLVNEEGYDRLHEILEQYRSAALWDAERGENPMLLAYQAFEVADPALLKKLDAWVKRRPQSWHARIARAFCHTESAAEARGSGWYKDLSARQIAGMMKHQKAAVADARAALALQPRSVAAYQVLLSIARHGWMDFELETKEALAAFPESYILRFETAWSLQPRWKGPEDDFAPLERFVRESQGYADKNPRLRRLLAFPYWARAQDMVADKKPAEAVGLYNAALAIAEDPLYLKWRARSLATLHDYPKAFADAKRYRDLVPDTGDEGARREVLEEMRKSARGWAAYHLVKGDSRVAMTTVETVLEHFPDDNFLSLVRATLRCRGGDVPGAIKDFERARAGSQATQHLDRLQAACVASDGKPIDAIRRAEARLLKEPGIPEAQFELGVLYSLVGDLVSAVTAYRAACELGVTAACERINGLREVARRAPALMQDELRKSWTLHEQERLRSAAEQVTFFANLDRSPDFRPGGPPVVFTERVLPDYPAWASAVKEGVVTVIIYFNKNGTVAGAKVESADPEGYFELAAVRAVLRWKIERRPMGLKARQRIEFKLPPDKPLDPNQDILIALARTPAPPP